MDIYKVFMVYLLNNFDKFNLGFFFLSEEVMKEWDLRLK